MGGKFIINLLDRREKNAGNINEKEICKLWHMHVLLNVWCIWLLTKYIYFVVYFTIK